MLPNICDVREVQQVFSLLAGRARLVPLVERYAALAQIDQIIAVDGIDEVHIGLNDLSIDLGYRNRLAVLFDVRLKDMSDRTRSAGVKLGIGGIGRALDTGLPVPSETVYARIAYLGGTGALLSRSFGAHDMDEQELAAEVARARHRLAYWTAQDQEALVAATADVGKTIDFVELAQ